jgi:hypothetical protein
MNTQTKPFALCIDNSDYQASLIAGKVYRIVPDARAAKDDLVRIVDESGEDYLYHKSYFAFVDFRPGAREDPRPARRHLNERRSLPVGRLPVN